MMKMKGGGGGNWPRHGGVRRMRVGRIAWKCGCGIERRRRCSQHGW